MKAFFAFSSGMLLASVSAQAQATLPNGVVFSNAYPVVAYDGVGNGTVVSSRWFKSGQVHVFLYTGDQTEPYGWFTLDVPTSIIPAGDRPICVAGAAWTGDDYAFGYNHPRGTLINVQQDDYNVAQGTVSFYWQASGGPLAPLSTYSINVICPPK